MNWKRRLEFVCGITTLIPTATILVLGFRIETAAAQANQQFAAKGFALWFAFYGLPSLLVVVGSYAHAIKKQAWGRVILIIATVCLTIWLFFSLALIFWSGVYVPALLLTALAILTSIISLFVRKQA